LFTESEINRVKKEVNGIQKEPHNQRVL